jgi:hypothetical protein
VGKGVIDQIGVDLQREFSNSADFSRDNVCWMRASFLAYRDWLPEPQTLIPWGQNISILQQVKHNQTHVWYARQGKAISNLHHSTLLLL